MTLGDKIKYLRKKNDMSQQTLADYLEINRNYLSRIETNKSEPTSTIILKLTNLFEISANALLGSNNSNSHYPYKPPPRKKTSKIQKGRIARGTTFICNNSLLPLIDNGYYPT